MISTSSCREGSAATDPCSPAAAARASDRSTGGTARTLNATPISQCRKRRFATHARPGGRPVRRRGRWRTRRFRGRERPDTPRLEASARSLPGRRDRLVAGRGAPSALRKGGRHGQLSGCRGHTSAPEADAKPHRRRGLRHHLRGRLPGVGQLRRTPSSASWSRTAGRSWRTGRPTRTDLAASPSSTAPYAPRRGCDPHRPRRLLACGWWLWFRLGIGMFRVGFCRCELFGRALLGFLRCLLLSWRCRFSWRLGLSA